MKTARIFLLLAALIALGISCSQNGTSTPPRFQRVELKDLGAVEATNVPLPQTGAFLIRPLTGDAATNQFQLLERLRQFPKQGRLIVREFTEPRAPKESIRYYLYKPSVTDTQALPLVLSLHGGGPRHRFEDLLEPHAPGFAYGPGRLISSETQRAHPSYVVMPWSNERAWDDDHRRVILQLLDALAAEFKIDTNRVYITGQSMGGFGTWSFITTQPARWAAAIPICGGGEPSDAPRAKAVPIWAFHGSGDTVVPVDYTRGMIHALRQAGGTPIYWEYKDTTHAGTAERAYCEPELMEWMFAQRRTR